MNRELDLLVAERVMGLKRVTLNPDWYHLPVEGFFEQESGLMIYSYDENACNATMYRNGKDPSDGNAEPLPYYSGEIETAWFVVDEMRKDDETLDRFIGALTRASTEKWVHQNGSIIGLPDLFLLMWKDLSPEAICRAALEAKDSRGER